jgi:hypothetical protein
MRPTSASEIVVIDHGLVIAVSRELKGRSAATCWVHGARPTQISNAVNAITKIGESETPSTRRPA